MSNFTFIEDYTTAEERVDSSIWIQGQKDVNGFWRFHDGFQMSGFLQSYMVESSLPDEDRLRYLIPQGMFFDRVPYAPHSYMCEHRFY